MSSFQIPSSAPGGGTISLLHDSSAAASAPSPTSTGISSGSGSAGESLLTSSRSSRTSSEAATSITRPDSQTGSSYGGGSKVLDGSTFTRSPQPYAAPSQQQQQQQQFVPAPRYADDMNTEAPTTSSTSTSTSARSNKPRATIVQGGKKRYPCSHPGCDKTFSTSGHAARHNRIHTGQKPYCCTFPGCQASFSRQDNALAHFRTGHAVAKGRANGGEDGDESGVASTSLSTSDAQMDAHAEMGRRALEEGTAIAVVRDGKVERTVGMPRGRAASSSASAPRATSRYSRSIGGGVSGVGDADAEGEDDDEEDDDEDMPDGDASNGYPNVGPTPAAEYAQSHRGGSAMPANGSNNMFSGGKRGAVDAIRENNRIISSHPSPPSVHSDYNSRTLPRPSNSQASHARRMHPYAYPTSHLGGGGPGSSYGGSEGHGSASQYDDYPAAPAPPPGSSLSSSPSWRRYSQVNYGSVPPPPPPPPFHGGSSSGVGGMSSMMPPSPYPPPPASVSSSRSDQSSPWQPLRLEGLNFNMRSGNAPNGVPGYAASNAANAANRKPSLPFPSSASPSPGTSSLRNSYFAPTNGGMGGGGISPGASSTSSASSSSYLPAAFARPFACSSDRSTSMGNGYSQNPYGSSFHDARRPPTLPPAAASSSANGSAAGSRKGSVAGQGNNVNGTSGGGGSSGDQPIVLPPLRLPDATPAQS